MSLTEEQKGAILAEAAGGPRAEFIQGPKPRRWGKVRRPVGYRPKRKAARQRAKAARKRGRKRK